ncbi:hypothetical protein [Natronomonas gomsonensis]|uniref:hypothetical protein n=1 Tax=Natronomonas gomsonensis TaxID=1046043 RepID=UPI0015C0B9D8|nr:hypothetical protein [Natronomonas gomsonensis]
MGSPKITNGIVRAVREIAIPSIVVLLGVVYARTAWGETVAGVVMLALTALTLSGIYLSAKYWTTTYTAGFALAGLVLLFISPDIVSELVHPIFGYLGTALVLVFLLLMLKLLAEKLGIDAVWKR